MDLGDRTEDSTIDFMFSTRNVSAAPAALASGVISVYKANGTTQSTAGITLTASFDSVTGLNHIRIDTSADAFYATSNDYIVVITTGTVNSVSVVGTTIATFSIENRFMRGTDSALLAASINLTAGAVDNVTTVATTTTNTDMRGTDSALLAASAPTNFSSQVISGAGAVDSLVQGFINTTLTESTSARINDNFEFFYDNANAQTGQVVDDVGGGGGGSGLTAQETRDAMKLAPTAGTPAAGSIDLHLDDIETDTGTTLPAQISGLNNFDPGSDAVANVTLVATTTTNTDMRGTNSALLAANINLTAGTVDRVTLVDTTTTNTDMRGTDSAATASALATAQLDLDTITGSDGATLATSQPNEDFGAIRKNANFSNIPVLMVLTSDHVTPATGLTVTGQRSIDGGAFAGVSGTIAEISNGMYQFDALAADTNGDTIIWRFSSATADDTFLSVKTVE